MWLMLVGRIVAWHFTIRSGDNQSCALQRNEKPQILYVSPKHTLSLNSGIFDMKEEAVALKAFFFPFSVRWYCEEEVIMCLPFSCSKQVS